MEKIILVNAVETSSQANSSRMNLDGNVVKIAITEGQQMPLCQVVLAKEKTTAITTNHLENTRLLGLIWGKGKGVGKKLCHDSLKKNECS